MNLRNIINRITQLPAEFKIPGNNHSIYYLLKEAGYFDFHDEINENDFVNALAEHPEHITDWIQWSEDKRISSGWYFLQSTQGKFIVGFYPGKDNSKQKEYSDIKEACAAFIKREIEEIRKNS